jgi:hypothetical protein
VLTCTANFVSIGEQIKNLGGAVEEFAGCIDSLPERLFLKEINGWSPRDVLAHMVGWNRYTIVGCQQIRRGETPFYFIDPGQDFSKVNAVLVQKYNSRDKRRLLDELRVSAQELTQFLLALDSAEWEVDFGVRYGGWTITIKNTVGVLIREYIEHERQIKEWADSQHHR